jgi:hypothetical protein
MVARGKTNVIFSELASTVSKNTKDREEVEERFSKRKKDQILIYHHFNVKKHL